MKRNISKFHVLGTLAMPLVAMAVLAILLSFKALDINKQASANQPNANLEFTLHAGGCSTAGDAKGNCVAAIGSDFVVSVSLDNIPATGYDAIAVTLAYTGVASANNPDIVWPDCAFEAPSPPNGAFVNDACAVGTSALPSTFTGTVFTATFNCAADGQMSLTHGPTDTLIIDHANKTSTETGPDSLNIDCVPITPTATTTLTSTPATAVSTPTETVAPPDTPPATSVATSTVTPTQASTPTSTAMTTPTQTTMQTPTATLTPTRTPTRTPTPTQTRTPTRTRTPSPGGLVGDVNCSGGISAIDAALILQLDAGIVSSLPCQQNGLVNGDGTVNSLDALLILQYVAGIIASLPA